MITKNLTGFAQLLEKLDRICLMTIQQDRSPIAGIATPPSAL
jgi:hypothetical protein